MMRRNTSQIGALLAFFLCLGGFLIPAQEMRGQESSARTTQCPKPVPTDPRSDLVEDQALVQVFVVGLTVVERENERGEFEFHFPETEFTRDRKHYLKVYQGTKNGNYLTWKEIGELRESNHTLTIRFPGKRCEALVKEKFEDVMDQELFPLDPNAARDARWLLSSKEIGEESIFQENKTRRHLRVPAGSLESCALFLDEYLDKACRTEAVGNPNRYTARPISEVAVIRQAVALNREGDASGCTPDVHLSPMNSNDGCLESITVPGCDADDTSQCVAWNGRFYKYVVDVLIAHEPERPKGSTKRNMYTEHGNQLRKLFRHGRLTDWDVRWPGNQPGHYCKDVQPPCWSYLKTRYATRVRDKNGQLIWVLDLAITSLAEASACPLVGYP